MTLKIQAPSSEALGAINKCRPLFDKSIIISLKNTTIYNIYVQYVAVAQNRDKIEGISIQDFGIVYFQCMVSSGLSDCILLTVGCFQPCGRVDVCSRDLGTGPI